MDNNINSNALYKNALWYSQASDILSNELLVRVQGKDFENFKNEDVGLFMPLATLMSFSCELFLKFILLVDSNINNVRSHNLKDLYDMVSNEMKYNIINMLLSRNPEFDVDEFQMYLSEIGSLFVESRYIHETCQLNISYEFLREFRNVLKDVSTDLKDEISNTI